jgi:hypothetical protein
MAAVHIDEITSDVTAVGAPPPPAAGSGEREWEQRERWRAMQQRLAADQQRLCAEGFDD